MQTLATNDEKLSAYNATSGIIPSPVESTIIKVCSDRAVKDYLKTLKTPKCPKILYECSKLRIHGTEYKQGQYLILPESSNAVPVFSKVHKLLCCDTFGYILYQETNSTYSSGADIYFVSDTTNFDVLPCIQLPSYHTIEGYPVGTDFGEGRPISLSIRNYIAEHV